MPVCAAVDRDAELTSPYGSGGSFCLAGQHPMRDAEHRRRQPADQGLAVVLFQGGRFHQPRLHGGPAQVESHEHADDEPRGRQPRVAGLVRLQPLSELDEPLHRGEGALGGGKRHPLKSEPDDEPQEVKVVELALSEHEPQRLIQVGGLVRRVADNVLVLREHGLIDVILGAEVPVHERVADVGSLRCRGRRRRRSCAPKRALQPRQVWPRWWPRAWCCEAARLVP